MKQHRTTLLIAAVIALIAAVLYFGRSQDGGAGPVASTSAHVPTLKEFVGHGVVFQYPDKYRAEVTTDNPELHQIAVSSSSLPGVLTIRFNPQAATAPIDLNAIANETRRGLSEGSEASMQPTRLRIGGQDVEGREFASTILGFPFTDVLAVVSLGGSNYVVLTHVADDDKPRAKAMFDAVLSTLRPSKN
jgi:hypothetical protein